MKLMLFCCEENMLITGENSVIMSSIENVISVPRTYCRCR